MILSLTLDRNPVKITPFPSQITFHSCSSSPENSRVPVRARIPACSRSRCIRAYTSPYRVKRRVYDTLSLSHHVHQVGEAPATSFADPFTSYEIRYGIAILSGKSNHPSVLPRIEVDQRNTTKAPALTVSYRTPSLKHPVLT